MQMAESAMDNSTKPATSRDTSNGYAVINVTWNMSVAPPAQYAIRRPAWNSVNMHRKKKQGCRPPSHRFHARPISETSISAVRTSAPSQLSQPMRKQSAPPAAAVKYPSSSSAAPNWGDRAAPAGYVFGEEFIAWAWRWAKCVAGNGAEERLSSAWSNAHGHQGPSAAGRGLRTTKRTRLKRKTLTESRSQPSKSAAARIS